MLVTQPVEGEFEAFVVVGGRDAGVGASELGNRLAQCSTLYTYVACILGVLAGELDLDIPHIVHLARAEQQVVLGSPWFSAASDGSCNYGTIQRW